MSAVFHKMGEAFCSGVYAGTAVFGFAIVTMALVGLLGFCLNVIGRFANAKNNDR